jgi:hypothetical protein
VYFFVSRTDSVDDGADASSWLMYRSRSSVLDRVIDDAPAYVDVIVVVVRVNDDAGETKSVGVVVVDTNVVDVSIDICVIPVFESSSLNVCVRRLFVVRLRRRAAALCEVGTGRRTIGW